MESRIPRRMLRMRDGRAIAKRSGLMGGIQSGNFAWKQRVCGELSAEAVEHLESAAPVFVAHVGNSQQNAGERSQIVSSLRCKLEVSNTRLLVSRQTAKAKYPAHRGGHAPDNVLAETGGQQSVVTVRTNRQQLLRPDRSLFGGVQGCQVALLDEGCVVRFETG